jgi:uncharacterized protein involved in cysteine biosynthesis
VSTLAKLGIVALIALGFYLLPGGGSALDVALTLLSIAFFTAIALLGYRLYRENRFTIDSLAARERLVLYGSIGLAFLTFTATPRLFVGAGVIVWLALLAVASYGLYWVWTQSRSYG